MAGNGAASPQPSEYPGWAQHEDVELTSLLDLAMRESPGLAAVRERRQAAEAVASQGLLGLLPKATLQAAAGRKSKGDAALAQFTPSTYPYSSLSASWELPLFGKAEAQSALANASVAKAVANESAAKLALVADVYQAYARGKVSKAKVAVLRTSQELAELEVAAVERAQALRLATLADVTSARQVLANISTEVAQANTEQRMAEHALQALTAEPTLQVAFTDTFALPMMPAPADPARLRLRPDVQAAEFAVGEAAATAGIAKADLWPQFTLSAAASRAPGTPRATSSSIGLNIPLLGWFAARAHAEASDAELRAAVFTYRETVAKAWQEAQDAEVGLASARTRATSLALVQASAKAQERAARTASALTGAVSRRDAWQSARTLADLELSQLDAELETYRYWAQLRKATFSDSTTP